jgi:hypothetical protein
LPGVGMDMGTSGRQTELLDMSQSRITRELWSLLAGDHTIALLQVILFFFKSRDLRECFLNKFTKETWSLLLGIIWFFFFLTGFITRVSWILLEGHLQMPCMCMAWSKAFFTWQGEQGKEIGK